MIVGVVWVVGLALGACGADAIVPADTVTDLSEVAEVEAPETDDDTSLGDAPEGDADAIDDLAADAPEGDAEAFDAPSGEVAVDRNCQFDARLANHRDPDRRCGACRAALGALRVRADLLWSGAYTEPFAMPEACAPFPDRACKASALEAEAVLCENLASGTVKVVWSDLVIARVGEGDEMAEHEVRGPSYGIRLAEVWRASPPVLLTPIEAFEPGAWKVGPPGEQVEAVLTEHPRLDDCPVGRFTIDGREGTIGPCLVALGAIGKPP